MRCKHKPQNAAILHLEISMKQILALLLILLLVLLTGCDESPSPLPSAEQQPTLATEAPETAPPTTAPATAEAPQPASISWAQAFRSKKAPEGVLTENEIAFRHLENGEMKIVNVPLQEVEGDPDVPEAYPRTHWYDQFLQPGTLELLPAIDYAILHGESSFVFPARVAEGGNVNADIMFLSYIYRLNNDLGGFSALTVTSTETAEGKVNWVLVHVPEIEAEQLSRFLEGLEKAKQIAAQVPEGSSQIQTALFLYQYLTDHLSYYAEGIQYYETDWSLLYDALIREETVCAGYADALQALYHFAGIDCYTIWGWIDNEWDEMGHAWNAAEIDGDWYLFDATWDTGLQPDDYRFFGVSSETLFSYAERDTIENLKTYAPAFDKDLDVSTGTVLFDTFLCQIEPSPLTHERSAHNEKRLRMAAGAVRAASGRGRDRSGL